MSDTGKMKKQLKIQGPRIWLITINTNIDHRCVFFKRFSSGHMMVLFLLWTRTRDIGITWSPRALLLMCYYKLLWSFYFEKLYLTLNRCVLFYSYKHIPVLYTLHLNSLMWCVSKYVVVLGESGHKNNLCLLVINPLNSSLFLLWASN